MRAWELRVLWGRLYDAHFPDEEAPALSLGNSPKVLEPMGAELSRCPGARPPGCLADWALEWGLQKPVVMAMGRDGGGELQRLEWLLAPVRHQESLGGRDLGQILLHTHTSHFTQGRNLLLEIRLLLRITQELVKVLLCKGKSILIEGELHDKGDE